MIPAHLSRAFNYLGIKEIPGKESHPKVAEWLQMIGLPASDEYAWCAAAMNGILSESGIEGTRKSLARSYLNWGTVLIEPKLGCVVILDRGDQPWMGHVSFYLDGHNHLIYCLGGNQMNRFGISMYMESKVLGYRWHNKFGDL